MPTNSNKLSQFWNELKRRRVVHVIVVYSSAAFVIIEFVKNVYDILSLPEWTPALTLIILGIGFPLAIIFSWIFDVTPDGLEKTQNSKEISATEISTVPNGWRIATYVSGAVIIGFLTYKFVVNRKEAKNLESITKSIAVLPFHNFSTEPDQEQMCLGLTDEIINHLYRIESFEKVSSLTSVLSYRNSDRNTPEIANELGVNYILEGVYKKIGDRLTVSAQLIDPKSDGHIWQHDYNRKYEDIMSIQSDIALQIANHLKVQITGTEKKSIEKLPTSNQEAYRYYWIGLRDLERGSPQIWDFKEAIKLDPNFALAHAYYARTYLVRYWTYRDRSHIPLIESKKAIDAALRLDPELPEAYIAKAEYYFYGFLDFENALKNLEIASDYKSTPECSLLKGNIYIRMGRWEEAVSEFEDALEQDPKSIGVLATLGETYYCLGYYQESIDCLRRLFFTESYEWLNTRSDKLGELLTIFALLLRDGNTVEARVVLESAELKEISDVIETYSTLLRAGYDIDVKGELNELLSMDMAGMGLMYNYSPTPQMPLMLEIFDGNFQKALVILSNTGWNGQTITTRYYPRSLFLANVYDLMEVPGEANLYYDSARIDLEAELLESPKDHRITGALGIAYAGLGEKEEAIDFGMKATELLPLSRDAYTGLFRIEELAWVYVMVEEYNAALEQIEILLSNPGPYSAALLQLDPKWKPLWGHPEFIRLIEQYAEKKADSTSQNEL